MTMRRSLLALAGGAWLALRAHARQHIRLRVRNASSEPFAHVWQGHPQSGTDIDLGPLAPGETSRWHTLPAVLPHYRKTRVQLAARQLVHVNDTAYPHGHTALAPGRYTFAYRIEGEALQLTVVKEPPESTD